MTSNKRIDPTIIAINPDSIIINEIIRAKYFKVKTVSNLDKNDFLGVILAIL